MYNKLSVKELFYLMEFCKILEFKVSSKYNISVIFKDGSHLVSGTNEPMDFDFSDKIAKIFSWRFNTMVIAESLERPNLLAKKLLTEDFFEDLPKGIDNIQPFLYSPVFYGENIPKLSFYILDPEKQYEVVSILCTQVQR